MNKKKGNFGNYAQYSGIAIKMLAIIFIGVFGGLKLDSLFCLKYPIFTVLFSVSSVILSIYVVVKDHLKWKKS